MAIETSLSALELADIGLDVTDSPGRERYVGFVRSAAGSVFGFLTGFLLINALEVGVGLGLEGENPPEWNLLQWGDHWAWRAVASLAATAGGAFVAGMVARRRGAGVAVVSALPTVLYWGAAAWVGWSGRMLLSEEETYLPLGYRIVATALALASLPIAAAAGREGAAYGRVNAPHFDIRRGAILGVRLYHYLWLAFLLHVMVLLAAFGAVYGFQWLLIAWRNGLSIFSTIPLVFYVAMLGTLQLLGTGALRTYEALAGFADEHEGPVWRQVLKFGFGYTLLAALAQTVISVVHYGLASLVGKISG